MPTSGPSIDPARRPGTLDCVVVGGGPAGLALKHLARRPPRQSTTTCATPWNGDPAPESLNRVGVLALGIAHGVSTPTIDPHDVPQTRAWFGCARDAARGAVVTGSGARSIGGRGARTVHAARVRGVDLRRDRRSHRGHHPERAHAARFGCPDNRLRDAHHHSPSPSAPGQGALGRADARGQRVRSRSRLGDPPPRRRHGGGDAADPVGGDAAAGTRSSRRWPASWPWPSIGSGFALADGTRRRIRSHRCASRWAPSFASASLLGVAVLILGALTDFDGPGEGLTGRPCGGSLQARDADSAERTAIVASTRQARAQGTRSRRPRELIVDALMKLPDDRPRRGLRTATIQDLEILAVRGPAGIPRRTG